MSYKLVTAIALGTVATSIGIMHFDPDREDEDGRYQRRILPDADAVKAEKKGLVEIEGDATEAEFKAQQSGVAVSARPAEVGAERLQEMEESPRGDAAGATPATATLRNFPAGQGRMDTLADPDAAPVEGDETVPGSTEPKVLQQSIPKLKVALADMTDVAELQQLREDEEAHQNRDGAKDAINDRLGELSNT